MEDRSRCVIVGYDGSDAARSAVLWAVSETDARNRLVALAVLGHGEAAGAERVEERWAQDGDGLEGMAELQIVHGEVAQALIAAADRESARMIVIGHPHARRLEPLRASVARDLLSHAPCPVVIVP